MGNSISAEDIMWSASFLMDTCFTPLGYSGDTQESNKQIICVAVTDAPTEATGDE